MTIVQLDPPIFLMTPKGMSLAHFLIDYGIEHDLYWVCFTQQTGECWTWSNRDIRIDKNLTIDRDIPKPFYEPDDVALTPLKEVPKDAHVGHTYVSNPDENPPIKIKYNADGHPICYQCEREEFLEASDCVFLCKHCTEMEKAK